MPVTLSQLYSPPTQTPTPSLWTHETQGGEAESFLQHTCYCFMSPCNNVYILWRTTLLSQAQTCFTWTWANGASANSHESHTGHTTPPSKINPAVPTRRSVSSQTPGCILSHRRRYAEKEYTYCLWNIVCVHWQRGGIKTRSMIIMRQYTQFVESVLSQREVKHWADCSRHKVRNQ